MKYQPIYNGSSEVQREMDGLLCFQQPEPEKVYVSVAAIEEAERRIAAGMEICDNCALAVQDEMNGRPFSHWYASRCWRAYPIAERDGGRPVKGFPGFWAMFQADYRDSTSLFVRSFDTQTYEEVPAWTTIRPMRASQLPEGKAEYGQRVKAEKQAGTRQPRDYDKNG